MSQYQLDGVWDDTLAKIRADNIPDEIAGVKTSDIIGYSVVLSVGLLSYFAVKRLRKKRRK